MAERFLEDRRRPIAGYDRIDFPEDEIAALRSRLDLETPLRVHWNWDYVKEVESLRALYERGKTAQWNAETELDWSIEVAPEPTPIMDVDRSPLGPILKMLGTDEATIKRCVFDELQWSLSQLLHGEQAALQLCAQLVNCIPDMDAKLFAGQQVVDECRHVEVFAKLIARKFGTVYPIGPNIKYLLDEMLSTPRWHFKLVGMQIMFEGVAMAILTDMGTRTTNALVRESLRLVARDEARHSAFGVLALREELAAMTQTERDELEDWTWKCLEVVANGLLTGLIDDIGPKYGLDRDAVANAIFTSERFWDGRYNMFNHTVLPNVRKLGIVTERTRPNYDRFRLWEQAAPYGGDPIAKEEFYGAP